MDTVAHTESELTAFLQDPASYPHRPDTVRMVQTHASYVVIASPFVYKVKKPVDFGFLDFSTLALRKHYCEQEVRLNRRLCSRIYEGVVPITRTDDGLAFEADGVPVEYVVKMQELEAEGFLHERLARDAVTTADLDRVVDRLVSFYQGQVSTPEIAEWGRIDRLKWSTDENFEQTRPFVNSVLPAITREIVQAYTDGFYQVHRDLLDRRREEGHILECHGDLHAEHIHFSDSGVCIYDCIEFNERFRYIDVANDVAFLAMDLDFLGRPDLSRYLGRRMAERLDDPDLPRLLSFYACYRAYVRGKVECLRGAEPEVEAEDRQAAHRQAGRYFRLALTYTVAGRRPLVLVVMGRVATGKSTVATRLGDLLGWEVASSDRVRKAIMGVPLYARGTDEDRDRLYAPEQTGRTYAALGERARVRAASGQSVILDATYSRRAYREQLRDTLEQEGVRCLFIELTATEAQTQARLRRRASQPQVVSDARLEDAAMLNRRYEPLTSDEGLRYMQVATGRDLKTTLGHILRRTVDDVQTR